jgi:hypothetical protein
MVQIYYEMKSTTVGSLVRSRLSNGLFYGIPPLVTSHVVAIKGRRENR